MAHGSLGEQLGEILKRPEASMLRSQTSSNITFIRDNPVIKRRRLFHGFVVSFRVPISAKVVEKPKTGMIIECGFPVSGGYVNAFVKPLNLAEPVFGRELISAELEIFEKELKDGRMYLYLHLNQVDRDPTHEFKVLQGEPLRAIVECKDRSAICSATFFCRTKKPLNGGIIVRPLNGH